MSFHGTKWVATQCHTTIDNVLAAIRRGKLAPPPRDETGRFIWAETDVDRVRAAMANDRRRNRQVVTS